MITLGLTACGPSYFDVVDDHRAETGTAYRDCGTIERNGGCPTDLRAAESCMLDAFSACQAAEVEVDQGTIEGDSIPEHWFVEADCSITRITDSSEDEYKGDYADLQRFACTSIEAPEAECRAVFVDGCSEVESY